MKDFHCRFWVHDGKTFPRQQEVYLVGEDEAAVKKRLKHLYKLRDSAIVFIREVKCLVTRQ